MPFARSTADTWNLKKPLKETQPRTVLTLELPDESLIALLRQVMRDVLAEMLTAQPKEKAPGLSADVAEVVQRLEGEICKLMTPWRTRQEAAKWLCCSTSKIDELANTDQIRRFEGPLYHRDDLDKCIMEGRFKAKKSRNNGKDEK